MENKKNKQKRKIDLDSLSLNKDKKAMTVKEISKFIPKDLPRLLYEQQKEEEKLRQADLLRKLQELNL